MMRMLASRAWGAAWRSFVWLLLIGSSYAGVALADEQPCNLLVILTEDQGAQMGALGTPGLQTPHMDALAASGVLFHQAYVAYPVCSASKAALYTGLHNHTQGLLNNTVNYYKPAQALSQAERNNSLYRRNRIAAGFPTLVERLHQAGYYQAVTHKLHVAPHEKFPYDEFLPSVDRQQVSGFIRRAIDQRRPWHLFFNVSAPHRPFPNSDRVAIRIDPTAVRLPKFLPDTPIVRQDWCEYLAAIEEADGEVGAVLEVLRECQQDKRTYVVFLGDHGPAFVHGKMTLHDLGLRVPLVIAGPGIQPGVVREQAVSELDIFPTLLELLDLTPLEVSHGRSLCPLLQGSAAGWERSFVFSEISHLGPLPNAGMQERSVCDGRWHLIYRERVETARRQVQADSKESKPWGNRSYAETVRVRDRFPMAYRWLSEFDPQGLKGQVPAVELYDLQSDPDELNNLAGKMEYRAQQARLLEALRHWVRETADSAVTP